LRVDAAGFPVKLMQVKPAAVSARKLAKNLAT